jgi:predicted aspartyl protease
MKFKYTAKWIDDYGISYTPRLPVIFSNPKTGAEIPLMSLVDSGASDTLLDPQVADLLGIQVTDGKKVVYGGVGGTVVGYVHTLTIRVADDRHSFTVPCAFASTGGDVMALLGQTGFFEYYKVTFEKYKNEFSVTAKT